MTAHGRERDFYSAAAGQMNTFLNVYDLDEVLQAVIKKRKKTRHSLVFCQGSLSVL